MTTGGKLYIPVGGDSSLVGDGPHTGFRKPES